MLPPAHRMRRGSDFSLTTRRGTKVSRGRVVCYVHLGAEPDGEGRTPAPVVGLIVGKTVGNSVVRHRAARRIRACLAPLIAELPQGARVVVRALPGADTDPRLCSDIRAAVGGAVDRGGRS